MAVALIVAAGRGERLGSGRPKALVTVAGKPLLEWSVDALRSVRAVRQIVVALPGEHLDAAPAGTVAVPGGAVRSESVRLALQAAASDDTVIVHDAARPLASPALFERALAELETSGADAVIAAGRVPDTIKEVGAGGVEVTRTVDRTRLWAAQTPQAFKRAALEQALLGSDRAALAAATDDAWLIERAGGVVQVIDSGEPNIKVTTETDLRIAETLLAR
ncbi:MAG: 2-C-methyl-D-erythritol 4-phosphate cytidylyltransferase [Solirubrobacterales bacterium]|nr:2-C-methyl-D-erythritol 4-phosphate cytidylyltransferase [Solirubrobacterales bacterium]